MERHTVTVHEHSVYYFVDIDTVALGEDFIRLSATRSTMAGKPYWVKCHEESPVQSGIWLSRELIAFRANRGADSNNMPQPVKM